MDVNNPDIIKEKKNKKQKKKKKQQQQTNNYHYLFDVGFIVQFIFYFGSLRSAIIF